jgi:uncharacterized protein YndB with AHSA1/START domain
MSTAPETRDREIVIQRTFAAPAADVFAAFTDARHIGSWYGPTGFTITTQQMDVRPGGLWRFIMHAPDGTDFPIWIRYRTIQPATLLAYDHGNGSPDGPPSFEVTITFQARQGATEVTMRSLFPTAAARNQVVEQYHAIEGGQQTMQRLSDHLASGGATAAAAPATSRPACRPFLISRTFQAPRQRVWDAWTRLDCLTRWFGPKGCTLSASAIDLRPGGSFLYSMRFPSGTMWGKWIFREVVAPERLVLTQHFSDSQGGVTRHPMSATWPLHTLSQMTLTEAGSATTMALSWSPWEASDDELRTFDGAHESMQQGWGGTLEQLTAFVEQPTA